MRSTGNGPLNSLNSLIGNSANKDRIRAGQQIIYEIEHHLPRYKSSLVENMAKKSTSEHYSVLEYGDLLSWGTELIATSMLLRHRQILSLQINPFGHSNIDTSAVFRDDSLIEPIEEFTTRIIRLLEFLEN
jgi:hypothetical protein